MKKPDAYRNNIQTYVKHFFLENYLERLVYNIGSFANEFVYVDGFSGPWKSRDEAFADTSFMIAINKLCGVRDEWHKKGRSMRLRCLFVEKEKAPFAELKQAVAQISDKDVDIECLNAKFEDAIPRVEEFCGSSFAFLFIDPTGWSGFGMEQLAPLLQRRKGEVLINFMYNYINRFVTAPAPSTEKSLNRLFGRSDWPRAGFSSEEECVEYYCKCLRNAGGYKHVTYTSVKMPRADRTYFHLVYGTHHTKGLREFRRVEKKTAPEEERARSLAGRARAAESGQGDLFAVEALDTDVSIVREKKQNVVRLGLRTRIQQELQGNGRVPYGQLLGTLLETPQTWESEIKRQLQELRSAGRIAWHGLGPRERYLKLEKRHFVEWLEPKSTEKNDPSFWA